MKKILAIGNSFSQDATKYLHDICKCGNADVKVVNLYIGGCSLKRHWNNAENDIADYEYELNGENTGRKVFLKQALFEDTWDIITMQQVSGESGNSETYFPYIKNLSGYVSRYCPVAKQVIHQTWAYEFDSTHVDFSKYESSQKKMHKSLEAAYIVASEAINAPIIPCGIVINALRRLPQFDYEHGGASLCRDGYHMDLVFGRYALSAVWYECLLGGNIQENSFAFDYMSEEDKCKIDIIKQTVHEICDSKPII